MTDKELLELAAKAYGGVVYVEDMGWIHEDAEGNRGSWWNPLTDDGDALRLAVKLELEVGPQVIGGIRSWYAENGTKSCFEVSEPDPYAATRRAIVRAAAEIGKEMK